MQPIKILINWLQNNTTDNHYIFLLQDFRALFLHISDDAFKTLLRWSVKLGVLERVCRGIYTYKSAVHSKGLLLFHAAAHLRSGELNYISLETALSDAGIISQVPINYITLMSSGVSNKVSCGAYGTIEFIHTTQKLVSIANDLVYDAECRLWRATSRLALKKDMKRTHRNCDLIDWDTAHELV